MTKKTTNLMKGVGAALAIGGTAAVIGSMMNSTRNTRKAKKTATKAVKTVENIIDSVQDIIG
ncbi:MAG: hypothetical protein GXY95_08160 [Clostridiales bacterium]|jgi:Fe-S oxidoreductase|nr:hypothetical protein [Clostridiales bacterium]HOA33830.1 hypothetical protein [Clostridiales bacterium]HOJ35005.1 hypothetical protein [Clostridiales bacterium]HOL78720.1 hypothetical protein [Clostridiales bacterium]HPP68720.1 hypothetical protein [Clostridiales bacterium]